MSFPRAPGSAFGRCTVPPGAGRTITNVERQSALTAPGHRAPASLKD